MSQGQWHWFAWLNIEIESNQGHRRDEIKELHPTTINSPFNYFIKWPSEWLSDCLGWIQVRGETKWPSLGAGSPHSHSTVYWYTLGHWLCVCVFVVRRRSKLLGRLCRRRLEVDVATAEWRDNRGACVRTPSSTQLNHHHTEWTRCLWVMFLHEQQSWAYIKFYETLTTKDECLCQWRRGGASFTALCMEYLWKIKKTIPEFWFCIMQGVFIKKIPTWQPAGYVWEKKRNTIK